MISGREAGGAAEREGVEPKRRVVVAAMVPASELKKNFLRDHFSISGLPILYCGLNVTSRKCKSKCARLKAAATKELGFEAYATPEFGAVVHGAVGDDELYFANVLDGV